MPAKTCLVSITDHKGSRHSVEVSAETLFEAAAEAAGLFRKHDWIEGVGDGARFEVEVKQPNVRHQVSMPQIKKWLEAAPTSPSELIRKKKLKELLAS
jgi:hypothetical protein